MREAKVRNRVLLLISYILKLVSYLSYIAVVIVLGLRALLYFINAEIVFKDWLNDPQFSNFTTNSEIIFKDLLYDPQFSNLFKFFGMIIVLLVMAYILRTMAKLVANVSKDIIFERKNVSYLRGMTIATFLLSFVISDQSLVDGGVILLSLTLFLFSMTLSRAIIIAEEQEFTI
ncbi:MULTISPECIES: hypothetical protein [unclassified Gemella]|uniref:hypothetical protein n=1 Tax=unclassified Gemella TaxID=2624949 RepID=UPI0010743E55|nr:MULTISPECIES: hypothetical protein [unclassified Gemella]MBF0710781.1 hypothetical protein [Gemella sp. GL1.1]MBF0746650.1 hypothetical protein [Gemella sp. 19428wG2_WT2a]NYS28125.1 hypothetical protein [Gemella sp. GL1]TFU60002.1 hypothetical protein E4T67_03180 [Gemella sp. WT2a]